MAKCWLGAYIARATVPVCANNRDQCLAKWQSAGWGLGQRSRFVPTTGTNASQCATCGSPEHWSRLLAKTETVAPDEPGPLLYTDEPEPLRGIGPGSEMNRERCLFWTGRKGGLSTSDLTT